MTSVCVGPRMSHYVVELFDISAQELDSEIYVSSLMSSIIGQLQLNAVETITHKFEIGVTCMAILSESHATIHTWPEYGYLYLELLSCNGLSVTMFEQAISTLFPSASKHYFDVTSLQANKEQVVRTGYPKPPVHKSKASP